MRQRLHAHRQIGLLGLEEFPPRVRPAADFHDILPPKQLVVNGVRVGLQIAAKTFSVIIVPGMAEELHRSGANDSS